jgi:thiol-disulfide isomerase/thioredoxin
MSISESFLMRKLFALLVLFLLAACSREEPVDAEVAETGPVADWRVSIALPEVNLPAQLHLAPDGSEAWFSNGDEKVRVPIVRHEEDTWTLRFPALNNTIVMKRNGAGFSGELTLVKRGYEQVMELSAEPDRGYRFVENPEPAFDFTGRWEVTFTNDDGEESLAIGEFDQQGGRVTGTFLTPVGDYRYLAGEIDGRMMHLSTFDGAHAFVFTASAAEDGTLSGDFWSGTRWHESWTAVRNFDASLPDAYELTFLKEGFDKLEFTFPNLAGNPVSLLDEKYRGKVVLVNLAGTWCPNCADVMDFLSPYFRENSSRGLEIISLLFEHFEDFDTASRLGKALVAKHEIGFDVLVAGSSDKAVRGESLPMLNHIMAFPTLIFIDRSGAVRRIHTGFSGPGTGQHFVDFKNEFTAQLDELLAESVPEG